MRRAFRECTISDRKAFRAATAHTVRPESRGIWPSGRKSHLGRRFTTTLLSICALALSVAGPCAAQRAEARKVDDAVDGVPGTDIHSGPPGSPTADEDYIRPGDLPGCPEDELRDWGAARQRHSHDARRRRRVEPAPFPHADRCERRVAGRYPVLRHRSLLPHPTERGKRPAREIHPGGGGFPGSGLPGPRSRRP